MKRRRAAEEKQYEVSVSITFFNQIRFQSRRHFIKKKNTNYHIKVELFRQIMKINMS